MDCVPRKSVCCVATYRSSWLQPQLSTARQHLVPRNNFVSNSNTAQKNQPTYQSSQSHLVEPLGFLTSNASITCAITIEIILTNLFLQYETRQGETFSKRPFLPLVLVKEQTHARTNKRTNQLWRRSDRPHFSACQSAVPLACHG